ncbi:MAG: hypothetical protein EOP49_24085 [Sphingobacteriales bacterium]|nr:MAG: hypothetical protein EOP49_24085 [Sphingobacteriales bacterium]
MTRILILFSLLLIASCKAPKVVEDENGFIGTATNKSCKIKGKILSLIQEKDDDTTTVCGRFPCYARVQILEVTACGPAATSPFKVGDEVDMQFTPTLQPTKNLFPSMKPRYPGLRRGDLFLSNSELTLTPNRNRTYVVASYLRVL